MVTCSSILAWKISWTEEPGGLQSIESQSVGHDWSCKHSSSWRLDLWSKKHSEHDPPCQLFTKPHVIKDKSVEVTEFSLLGRERISQGQPRHISLGKKICQMSNLKKLEALKKFKNFFSPFKNPLNTPGEKTNHVLRVVVIYSLLVSQNCWLHFLGKCINIWQIS